MCCARLTGHAASTVAVMVVCRHAPPLTASARTPYSTAAAQAPGKPSSLSGDARQPTPGAVFRSRRDRPPVTVEPSCAAVQAVRAVVGDQSVAPRDHGPVLVAHLEPRVRDAVRDAADDRAEVRAVDCGIVALQVVVPERDVRHDAVSVGNEDARDRRAEGETCTSMPGARRTIVRSASAPSSGDAISKCPKGAGKVSLSTMALPEYVVEVDHES